MFTGQMTCADKVEMAGSGQHSDLFLSSAHAMQREESVGLRSLLQNGKGGSNLLSIVWEMGI